MSNRTVNNKIHLRLGCKERLYLPRTELGRGLHSVEFKSEHMLLQLLDCLEKSKETSTRRAAILRENDNKTHLALIKTFYNVNDSSRWLKKGSVRPRDEAVFCYIQDRNVFWRAEGVVNTATPTRCEKMLGHDYTRRHNEVVRCIHLLLLNKYKFKSSKRIRSHSVQEILDNEYAEIRVDTRIKTDVKIRNNRPDIFVLDKRRNKITLIEVGITSQDSLQIVETEKLRKYNLLANELGLIYKCSVEIIPYEITWAGIVTKYHKTYLKRLQIPINVEAYIQSIVIKKTVEMISFDRRRGIESGPSAEESWERASLSVIIGAEMHKEPTPPLKEVKNEEDSVKQVNSKNILLLILDDLTRPEEPTIDINDKSDVEKENKVVKVMEEISQPGRVNQTIKRWLAKKLHETSVRKLIEYRKNVVYSYKRTINSFNNTISGIIIVENEASTMMPAIDIDPDMHFKNYREIIIESNNSNKLKRDLSIKNQVLIKKNEFDRNTKTKRAPFDSFYDNSVFTIAGILMNNMIEVKKQ
ncbi:hypothetical protein CWI38_0550p0030 [Hamiltosporidium tvaerminnensis]|uniref:Reverse transcriptase n=1 Tax=Hamiltosporidium tvaerminnensis TaxID=1176355 RepID=A0A4V2JXT0_9MICR|nr:hypothetical protein CWI38_0550p0030 [Hamiltosporidium tvaerminnensis]